MSCGVGHRCGSDLVLLWLWCRPAVTALIRLLAWEPPYATDVALKGKKTKTKTKQTNKKSHMHFDETEQSESAMAGMLELSDWEFKTNMMNMLKILQTGSNDKRDKKQEQMDRSSCCGSAG